MAGGHSPHRSRFYRCEWWRGGWCVQLVWRGLYVKLRSGLGLGRTFGFKPVRIQDPLGGKPVGGWVMGWVLVGKWLVL